MSLADNITPPVSVTCYNTLTGEACQIEEPMQG